MLAISLGDPTGIGPEVVVKALAERPDIQIALFGDVAVIDEAAQRCGVSLPAGVRVHAVSALAEGSRIPGQPNDDAGKAQVAYLVAATNAALAGTVTGIVTAPISKDWAGRAGFAFPGHTEYLAQACETAEFAMMLAGPGLKVTVATTHIALRDVPRALTIEAIERAIRLTIIGLQDQFGIAEPRVAVAALNPHAGENGKFGDEEARLIGPAIELAKGSSQLDGRRFSLQGPAVPDVVFRQAALGMFDAVVAMYHDQGLIPVKLHDFDRTVNVTLGLPFVRTSPDHGTAYDLAGSGKARPDSFAAALDLATKLVSQRVPILLNRPLTK
jgi:4-hydroxythreonine-4-phosphate dehydrogenase